MSFKMLLAVALFFISTLVEAHESIGSVSNGVVLVHESTVDYYLSVPPTLKSQLFDLSETAWYRDYFSTALKISSGGDQCPLVNMSAFAPQPSGNSIVNLTYKCPALIRSLSVSSEAFLDFDEKHVQLIKIMDPNDLKHVLHEGMLTARDNVFQVDEVHTGGSLVSGRITRFFELGVEHILTGFDHILFLLAVILVSTRAMDTLKMVTSFTVAHSITLGLAFAGVITIPAAVVEPLIALTIVYVAFDNLVEKRFNNRWLLTFAFGLIHGLGFVGVLKEITISRDELLTALVSFNLGIEAGQLLIVIPLSLVFYLLRNRSWRPAFIRWSSAGTGLVGALWLFERVPFASLLNAARKLL